MTTAPEILQAGIDAMADRAATRDTDAERSMARAVATYNALTGSHLTEVDGWQFMACLKMARSRGGGHNLDDYVDGAAYAALAGEAAHSASLGPYAVLAREYERREQARDTVVPAEVNRRLNALEAVAHKPVPVIEANELEARLNSIEAAIGAARRGRAGES